MIKINNINNKVKLKLLPVCECGYIFNDFKINSSNSIVKDYSLKIVQDSKFSPSHCPNCGKEIESIEYSKNLLNNFIK